MRCGNAGVVFVNESAVRSEIVSVDVIRVAGHRKDVRAPTGTKRDKRVSARGSGQFENLDAILNVLRLSDAFHGELRGVGEFVRDPGEFPAAHLDDAHLHYRQGVVNHLEYLE